MVILMNKNAAGRASTYCCFAKLIDQRLNIRYQLRGAAVADDVDDVAVSWQLHKTGRHEDS